MNSEAETVGLTNKIKNSSNYELNLVICFTVATSSSERKSLLTKQRLKYDEFVRVYYNKVYTPEVPAGSSEISGQSF